MIEPWRVVVKPQRKTLKLHHRKANFAALLYDITKCCCGGPFINILKVGNILLRHNFTALLAVCTDCLNQLLFLWKTPVLFYGGTYIVTKYCSAAKSSIS